MELLDVIKHPMTIEKSILAMDEKKYTFEANTRVNKALVKQAIESAFDVRVANVSILSVRPKFKRMGRYVGYTKKRRRAIVILTEDSKEIQLFGTTE